MDIQSLRKYRVSSIAIFDVSATLLGGYLAHKYLFPDYSLLFVIIMMFILGIIVHYVFGIDTQLNYYIGLNKKIDRNPEDVINLL